MIIVLIMPYDPGHDGQARGVGTAAARTVGADSPARAVGAGPLMARRSNRARWEGAALGAIADQGRRPGGAGRAVVELLAGEACCLSAAEIGERLRSGRGRVGTASVYRTLDRLHAAGLVQRLDLPDAARYEAVLPGGGHHHHAVCDRCGRITPFEDPALERAITALAKGLRHRVSGHDVVVRGECPGCSRR